MQFLKAIVSPRKLFAVIVALGLASCADQDPEPQSNGIVAPKGNFTVSVADGKIVSNNMEYIKSFPQLEQALKNIAAKNSSFSLEVDESNIFRINGENTKSTSDFHEFLISEGGFQYHETDFYFEVNASGVKTNAENVLKLYPSLSHYLETIRTDINQDVIVVEFDKHGRLKHIRTFLDKSVDKSSCGSLSGGCSYQAFKDCVGTWWFLPGLNIVLCGAGVGAACLCEAFTT